MKMFLAFAAMLFSVPAYAITVNPASSVTADSANTALTIPYRDASGNFAAGTITATLSGSASTVSALAIDSTKLAASSVDSEKLIERSITGAKLVNLTVDSTKLGALSVDSEKIAKNAVQTEKIRSDSIDTSKMLWGTVGPDSAKILCIRGGNSRGFGVCSHSATIAVDGCGNCE